MAPFNIGPIIAGVVVHTVGPLVRDAVVHTVHGGRTAAEKVHKYYYDKKAADAKRHNTDTHS